MDLIALRDEIKGPVFPIITPFDEHDQIDFLSLEKYIEYLYEGGARIFYTMAHSSRLSLLSTSEITYLNTAACGMVKSYPDTIYIGATPMYKNTAECVQVAKDTCFAGADLISVIFSERYYSDKQVVEFFKTIADKVNCGILVHEEQLNTIHGTQRMNWPMSLLKKVIDIENVIAIKEDAKDDGYTEQIVKELHKEVAIIVSGGSKEQFLKFGPMGCQAYLVGLASVFPKVAQTFYKAYLDGNFDVCKQYIKSMEAPFFAVTKDLGWHVGVKSALEDIGMMSRRERRPLMELEDKDHWKVEDAVLPYKGVLDK